MRSKLNFLIHNSISKKIKSKWFLVANIIISILIIAIINLDSIILLFGGDFSSKKEIYIYDETKEFYNTFEENLNAIESNMTSSNTKNYEVKLIDSNIDEKIDELKKQKKNSVIIEIKLVDNKYAAKIISLSTIDTYDYQIINSAISSTANMLVLESLDLSEDELSRIYNSVDIEREILDENITSEDENMEMIMTTVFPVLILPFFMLTLFLVQFIGTEINDEKSTRSMEIIISNVSPKTHFISKIIANNLFILLQALLMMFYGAIGLFIRKLIGGDTIINGIGQEVSKILRTISTGVLKEDLILVLIFAIILMILTFIAYSLVAGILASMTTNSEDFQHIQVPIIITLLLGYYLSMIAGMFKGSLIIKIFSFVPFISAILAPSLLILGQIGVVEIIISIILMILTIYILLKYGMRIYKEGILNYSQTGIWKKIFKSIRSK